MSDSGFRPEANGFSFPNYGNVQGRNKLTAAELRRMFGDEVCSATPQGACILTPAATKWMGKVNNYMSGGHCEGLAVLSLLFYSQQAQPSSFKQGTSRAFDLAIDDNPGLQREIAFWYATQLTSPTTQQEIKGKTPNEILDLLIAALKQGRSAQDTYTLGIYRPGFQGGHTLTPFAVEDNGGGRFSILVYDNNYPNVTRKLEVDRNANAWLYNASTNPQEATREYRGDAQTKTMTLVPTSARRQEQICPFCSTATQGGGGGRLSAPLPQAQRYNQVWLAGAADLLITDGSGRRIGYLNGNLVNEIPGAFVQPVRSDDLWKDSPEPLYILPTNARLSVTLDGNRLAAGSGGSVTLIGPGYDVALEEINVEPGQQDTLTFAPDGRSVEYRSESGESPDVIIGFEAAGADYAFEVNDLDIDAGGTIILSLDDQGRLALHTEGNDAPVSYDLEVHRIDDQGEEVFAHDDLVLGEDDTIYIDYEEWDQNGEELTFEVDEDSDGDIDDTDVYEDEGEGEEEPYEEEPYQVEPTEEPAIEPTEEPTTLPTEEVVTEETPTEEVPTLEVPTAGPTEGLPNP